MPRKVLNVGGNNREIAIPKVYDGWAHHLLDIDPAGKPDIVADARELDKLPAAGYDAVYCSHNLEHFHSHEVPKVLAGFAHVLNDEGFADIRVPDVGELMKRVVEQKLDLDAVLYTSPAGPVTPRDVLWGHSISMLRLKNEYFAHKTGFTQALLRKVLAEAGFRKLYFGAGELEIRAIAFRREPSDEQRGWFSLKG